MSGPSAKAAERCPEPLGGSGPEGIGVVFGWLADAPWRFETRSGRRFATGIVRTQGGATAWRLVVPPGEAYDEFAQLRAGDFVMAKGLYESQPQAGNFILHVDRIISVAQPRMAPS